MIVTRSIFTPKPGKRREAVALIKVPGADFPFPSVFRIYTCWIGVTGGTIALETEHESLADYEKWQAETNAWADQAFWERWREVIEPAPNPSEIWRLED